MSPGDSSLPINTPIRNPARGITDSGDSAT
jgi:hypothetical protein